MTVKGLCLVYALKYNGLEPKKYFSKTESENMPDSRQVSNKLIVFETHLLTTNNLSSTTMYLVFNQPTHLLKDGSSLVILQTSKKRSFIFAKQ